mmetsp:Transcript_27995/g.90516  ORF Transcript_27995/g.90516 Transcript_27995/m.90516 type:complete len:222 (-) Transcript_27995:146-811(-)
MSILITAVTSQKSTPRDTPNSASVTPDVPSPAAAARRLRLEPEIGASAGGGSAESGLEEMAEVSAWAAAARADMSLGSSVAMRMSKRPLLKACIACHRDSSGSSQLSTPADTPNCSRNSLSRNPRSTALTNTSDRPGIRFSLSSAYINRNLSGCEQRSQNWRSPDGPPPSVSSAEQSTVAGLCRNRAEIASRSGVSVAESSMVWTDRGSSLPTAAMSSPYP